MKGIIAILAMFAVALALIALPSAYAQTRPAAPFWGFPADVTIGLLPAGTIVPVTETYSKMFALNTAGITWATCHDINNYQFGSCDYLYKCYIILPEGCDTVTCAKDYACIEILTLQATEPITVSYTTQQADIGKNYAVAAFILKSAMTYNFQTKLWTDVTIMIDSTKQSDIIQIQGAGQPPVVDPIAKLSQFIAALIAGLKSWICSVWGVWC